MSVNLSNYLLKISKIYNLKIKFINTKYFTIIYTILLF